MRTVFVMIMVVMQAAMLRAGDVDGATSAPVEVKPGIFGPAAVVRQGAFVVAAETQLYFEGDSKFGVLGHLRYGLMPSFEINADIGVNRGEFYFGANVDYQAVHDRAGSPGVLIRGGAFVNDPVGSGINFAGLIGNQFDLINLYGGLETKFIVDPTDVTVFNLLGGIQIPFQRNMRFIGEFGLNANNKDASYLSAGVLFVL